MKIKLDSLMITEYCSTDKRKYRFINEVGEDPLINQFVSYSIKTHLESSEGLNKLVIGPAYIVADDRKFVGIIRLANYDFDGILNLHYAVHPDYRKQHYGTKILKEVPKYLFKNIPDIKEIELWIRDNNIGSVNCAIAAGFNFDRCLNTIKSDQIMKVYSKKR